MPDELVYVVSGVDAAGIDHGKEFPDAFDAQQHHLKLLGMARAAEKTERKWQKWPDIDGRPVLGAPVKREEAKHHEPARKPQRRRPYDD